MFCISWLKASCIWRAGAKLILPVAAKTLSRSIGHYNEWIRASKGGAPAGVPFEVGGLLTEIVLLGNVAIRTRSKLQWDAKKMVFANNTEANKLIREPYRKGWEVEGLA